MTVTPFWGMKAVCVGRTMPYHWLPRRGCPTIEKPADKIGDGASAADHTAPDIVPVQCWVVVVNQAGAKPGEPAAAPLRSIHTSNFLRRTRGRWATSP